jgi:hypothetical protein
MPTLTPEQIAGVIKYYNTGGPSPIAPVTDNNGVIAVAIALAESGGNTEAVGGPNSNGTYDYGLWQINSIHNPPERVKTSAASNWLFAWRIAGFGLDWSPWSSYKSQNGKSPAYLAHMDVAKKAWGTAKPETIGGNASGEVKNAPTHTEYEGPLAFLNVFLIPGLWTRVAMMTVGALLILLVVASMLSKSKLANMVPMGRAINMVKGASA